MTLPIVLEGIHATFTIDRPTQDVVVVVIKGRDAGEHGDHPLRALDDQLAVAPFALFVDARKTSGASIDVSNVWARWLRANRDRLHRIHMLTSSRFVQLTADFVRRFAELGDAMLVYTDPVAFDSALRDATAAPGPR